jgi:hypothetical protein
MTAEWKTARPDDATRPSSVSASPGAAGAGAGDAPFTALLRSDAVTLIVARRAMEEHGGGLDGDLAARRVLDAELRASSGWPTEGDYLTAAADYDRGGQLEDAEFLRRVAGTDRAIDTARTWWNLRYQDRPRTPADDLIASMRQAGLIEFDPAGPYLGVDGASYEPGVLPLGAVLEPVVVVSGRGASELITGWPDYAAMSEWIATRGTTASGPLTPPPGRRDCRTWQEDQILARLLTSPSDAPLIAASVPPGTFTTDVRYDIYQAIVQVRNLGPYAPGDISAEFARRMTAVPGHGLARYGGAAAPFARAYLARLADTIVGHDTAMSVASLLVQEDSHYRSLARPAAPGQRSAAPATVTKRDPVGATRPGQQPRYPRPQPPAPGPSPMPRP